MRFLLLVCSALMLVGCFGRSTTVQLECKTPSASDPLLLQPTKVPPPPTARLSEPVAIEHFRVLYSALGQCNSDKKDFLDVYYPVSAPGTTVPTGD